MLVIKIVRVKKNEVVEYLVAGVICVLLNFFPFVLNIIYK